MITNPKKVLFRFLSALFLLLAIAYAFHRWALFQAEIDPQRVLLTRAYLINVILAALILGVIFFLRERFFSQIGFLFLAGSMLKFGAFFLFFNPHYKADGDVTKPEFIGFFIPYVLSLIIETLAVSRLLKSKPDTDS